LVHPSVHVLCCPGTLELREAAFAKSKYVTQEQATLLAPLLVQVPHAQVAHGLLMSSDVVGPMISFAYTLDRQARDQYKTRKAARKAAPAAAAAARGAAAAAAATAVAVATNVAGKRRGRSAGPQA
jgi:hypothetical protein